MSTDPNPQSAPRLEVRNLTRHFGDKTVVDEVSFAVAPGQVTCLLGPSGCGKSTTLRMIAGVETQSTGEIYVDGQMICGPGRFVAPDKRRIGLIFQDFALFPHLNVTENIAFGLATKGPEAEARVATLLDKVGLSWAAKAYPHALSGGEQQRVALVRALAPKPRIMLMDEPFSGLDNRLRDGIRDETLALLKEEETAVVLVTHEPEEALRMGDNIALMRAGRVVQSGTPYVIYNSPADREAMAFFSDINVIRGQSNGALTETPFGPFLTPGVEDGAMVDIVIRPQHLHLDFDRNGRGPSPSKTHGIAAAGVVERARFMGRESLVEFRMEHDGSVLKATVPNVFLPSKGTRQWLSLRRDKCFVFPVK